jgi:hypothetical protein
MWSVPRRSPSVDPLNEIAGPMRLPFAAVVHTAAALYLGLGDRGLRDVVAMGFSLADVAEWRGETADGLERAIANALRRTAGPRAVPAAARVLDFAAEGWSTRQATVEQIVAIGRPSAWRAIAA